MLASPVLRSPHTAQVSRHEHRFFIFAGGWARLHSTEPVIVSSFRPHWHHQKHVQSPLVCFWFDTTARLIESIFIDLPFSTVKCPPLLAWKRSMSCCAYIPPPRTFRCVEYTWEQMSGGRSPQRISEGVPKIPGFIKNLFTTRWSPPLISGFKRENHTRGKYEKAYHYVGRQGVLLASYSPFCSPPAS